MQRTSHWVLALALGYVGGVAIGSFFSCGWLLACLWGGVSVASAKFVFPKYPGIVLGMAFVGFAGGSWHIDRALDTFHSLPEAPVMVYGIARVIDEPEEKQWYRHVVVSLERCESDACPSQKILWQASRLASVHRGERLMFRCELEHPKNFSEDFDYRMYLARQGIGYLCNTAEVKALPNDALAIVWRWFLVPKHFFEEGLERSLPEPEAGLAKGLLLGGSRTLPPSLEEAFRQVGVSHIIAVSGYNMTLIAYGLVWLGIGIGLWRRQASLAAVVGIIAFVVMIGAPPSAVRAGVMASIVFMATLSGRVTSGFRALLFAGAGMLVVNPLLLRHDVGFQLSFLATFAILSAASLRSDGDVFLSERSGWWEMAYYTAAVEVWLVPVLLYHFHFFFLGALAVNMLVLPLVPLAMGLSLVAGIGAYLFPSFAPAVGWPAESVLSLIVWVVERSQLFVSARITTETFSFVWALFWYAGVGFGIFVFKRFVEYRSNHDYAEERLG